MALSGEYSEKCNLCNRLVFEAVNENSISKLQSAKRTYSDTELLTSLVQFNEKGETPLLVAMKGKNVSLIDELLKVLKHFNHKTNKCQAMSPMCLYVIDQLSKQIPIMELIEYLIKDLGDENGLKFIAQVFLKSSSFTQQDRIIALELIGASILCSYKAPYLPNLEHIESCTALLGIGLQCWREAMTLCHTISYALPKTPETVYVPYVSSSIVFGSAIEVMTMDELDLLEERIKRNSMSTDSCVRIQCQRLLKRQALLVVRRICSQTNHERPYWLYLKCLLSFGSDALWNLGREFPDLEDKIAINTCHLILKQMNGIDPKLLSVKSLHVFIETLNLMSCYFIRRLMKNEHDEIRREECLYASFLASTEFINTVSNLFPNPAAISSVKFEYFCFAEIIYRFLFVLKSISPQITHKQKQKLEGYYSNYIRNLFPERTTTVLHVAIQETKTTFQMLRFDAGAAIGFGIPNKLKSIHTQIKLILKLGADPNAIDEDGRTPLNVLAGMKKHDLNKYLPIYKTLVNAGSDLYTASDNGETILRNLQTNLIRHKTKSTKPSHPYFGSLIYAVFPLSCYAARVIRRHGIRFDDDRLPRNLQTFVSR